MVIDYGCGNMPYKPLFEAAGAATSAPISTARQISPSRRTVASVPPTPAPTSSVSFQVLEHVRDLGRYFAEARRVLKPGGRMVLSTHGTWLYHPHPEDHRRWTRQGLIADMEAHGFKVTDARRWWGRWPGPRCCG